MKTVKIANIKARAKRLKQPEMVAKYREYAISWKDGICELEDSDHAMLNEMWDENSKPSKPKKCKNCGGLR